MSVQSGPERDGYVAVGKDGGALGLRYLCEGCGRAHVIHDGGAFDRRMRAAETRVREAARALFATAGIDPARACRPDDETGTVTLSGAAGPVTLSCATVGEWTVDMKRWRWAWSLADDRTPAPVRAAVERLRDAGVARQWDALTRPVLIVGAPDAMRLAAFAADLTGHAIVLRSSVEGAVRFHVAGHAEERPA